jgi:hypothetical protein
MIATQPTMHRDSMIKKNDFVTALETKINVIIQKMMGGKYPYQLYFLTDPIES